jgi:hypothetical protein
MALAQRASADCKHACDLRIEQAFGKHALPDHPDPNHEVRKI